MKVLGLMSGTSADGVDAALLEVPGDDLLSLSAPVPRARVLAHTFTPYTAELRERVLRAMRGEVGTAELAQLHWALGAALADAARELAPRADLIASHGQTVQHHPRPDPARGWARPATLQLGEAAVIAEATGKPVVSDFRPADLAAGGVGAPLVPFADWAIFAEEGHRRVLLNVGGLANITFLPGVDAGGVVAFDTGPGNGLLDEIAAKVGQSFDEDGKLAAQGREDAATLERWLAHPELAAPPPKATGREVWTLSRLPAPPPGLSVPDLAATATRLTARSVADALRFLPAPPDEVVIAGGGARNPTLLGMLRGELRGVPLRTFADLGWDAHGWTDATREAAAFALLGYCHARGWPNTLPQTTGARRAVSGGKLTPAPSSIPPSATSEDSCL
ncbi:anhydro-N-acetylmuramic acid kinase [Deinococcus sp. VB343]|uniref:Anhydro-N-acetylmuramic acid kinase n=1 Tax=Deinococcus sp. VB142 TaxID=3112952 RepID=A0AAU6Q708_9DEIO